MAARVDDSESEDEFYGFDTSNLGSRSSITDAELSDISVSSVSTPESSDYETESESEGNEISGPSSGGSASWSSNLKSFTVQNFVQPTGATFTLTAEATELDFVTRFFTDTLLQNIVNETNRYAAACISKKSDPLWNPVTAEELKAVFGLHVWLSVVPMPSYKMAWTTNKLFSQCIFGAVMTRNRFEHILKYFHVSDVSNNPPRGQPGHDRLALANITLMVTAGIYQLIDIVQCA